MIPYGKQSISTEDIDSVVRVLESDWLTQGPVVPRFEKALCDRVGCRYASLVNSGTSALHLAYLSLGLTSGDRLWTSPITFLASANAALFCGASVDFVDIDSVSGNMDVEKLKAKLIDARKNNCLPKIITPVHYAGSSCDMQAIAELAEEFKFNVVEDAAHALGGTYQSVPVGAGEYSDITVLSFHPVKIITAGEGGAVLTNSEAIKTVVDQLRSHGMVRDESQFDGDSHGAWYYEQQRLGFNYRVTDIQAALGLSQLERLNEFILKRERHAQRYDELLQGLPIHLPTVKSDVNSAWHLYPVQLTQSVLDRIGRKSVYDYLRDNGIGVQVHYIPVHLQPYYKKLGFNLGDFPAAERFYQGVISLPIFPALTQREQDKVIAQLASVLKS